MGWLHGSLHSALVLGSPIVTVHTHDGRTVDVSGLSAADAIARLQRMGIALGDIARTEWRIPKGTIPGARDVDA